MEAYQEPRVFAAVAKATRVRTMTAAELNYNTNVEKQAAEIAVTIETITPTTHLVVNAPEGFVLEPVCKDLLEYVKMVRQGIDAQQKEEGGVP